MIPALMPMAQFVDEIGRLTTGRLDADRMQRLLSSTLIEPASLDVYARFESGRYTRHLVHKSAQVEILVLCWAEGARAPIHGHEGELCWARVERGTLRFTNYLEVLRHPLRVRPVGPALVGGPGHLDGPADLHAVENPQDFGGSAMSVHVYSKPYDECDIYDLEQGTVSRVRLRYDSVPASP
jgi:NitT/TauT family transport system ATP-binding protein